MPRVQKPARHSRFAAWGNRRFASLVARALRSGRSQQSIAVIDLNATPEPRVTQNVYFPTPQSANVGLAFAPVASAERSFAMYVSGGFENKVWIFRFDPKAVTPVQPASP